MSAEVAVNLDALQKNAIALRSFLGEYYCVLKCDAYGHGARECADALYRIGQRHFAVFSIDEALEIKSLVRDSEVLILGRSEPGYAEILKENRFIQTVFSSEYAQELVPFSQNMRVHIKIDCGMNRCGFKDNPEKIKKAFSCFKGSIEGVYTHFPCADIPDTSLTECQLKGFLNTAGELEALFGKKLIKHSAASAAAIRFPNARLDRCRLGLALYGVLPDNCKLPFELSPAMSFKADVISVKTVRKGENIGYGCDETLKKDTVIATVACGYANGLSRSAARCLRPKINGYSTTIIGRICMDRCMLDVSELFENGQSVKPYDTVDFFNGVSMLDAFSTAEKTIPYEILTRVGKMNKRNFK